MDILEDLMENLNDKFIKMEEMKCFFEKKDEIYNTRKEEESKKREYMYSIYKKRVIYIKNEFFPIFLNFCHFLNEKNITCELIKEEHIPEKHIPNTRYKSDWEKEYEGIGKIIISIHCCNGETAMFVFSYIHYFLPAGNVKDNAILIDAIELGVKNISSSTHVGDYIFVPTRINTSRIVLKDKETIKFDEVSEEIILRKLSNWVNQLINENLIIYNNSTYHKAHTTTFYSRESINIFAPYE
jgi:hypothetical protein